MQTITELVDQAIILSSQVERCKQLHEAAATAIERSGRGYDRRTKLYREYEKTAKELYSVTTQYRETLMLIGKQCVNNYIDLRARANRRNR